MFTVRNVPLLVWAVILVTCSCANCLCFPLEVDLKVGIHQLESLEKQVFKANVTLTNTRDDASVTDVEVKLGCVDEKLPRLDDFDRCLKILKFSLVEPVDFKAGDMEIKPKTAASYEARVSVVPVAFEGYGVSWYLNFIEVEVSCRCRNRVYSSGRRSVPLYIFCKKGHNPRSRSSLLSLEGMISRWAMVSADRGEDRYSHLVTQGLRQLAQLSPTKPLFLTALRGRRYQVKHRPKLAKYYFDKYLAQVESDHPLYGRVTKWRHNLSKALTENWFGVSQANLTKIVRPLAGKDFTNSIGVRMKWISLPSGNLWISTTEVEISQWLKIMGFDPTFKGLPREPHEVNSRPIHECSVLAYEKFIKALSRREQLKYDFPTVMEFVNACKAGGSDVLYGKLDEIAWYNTNYRKNFNKHERLFIRPVGQKKPNAFGLYDMIGNTHEVCKDEDGYHFFGCDVYCPKEELMKIRSYPVKDASRNCGFTGLRLVLRPK